MNIANSLNNIAEVQCKIYTTYNKNNSWFSSNKIKIKRFGFRKQNSILRYLGYLQFNFFTICYLIINKPKVAIAFEAYSVLPLFLYKKLFPNAIIFVHYHEYVTLSEIKSSSLYNRFLHLIEKKLFISSNYVSQTNLDRLNLFLKDYPFLNKSRTFVAPNLPPMQWNKFAKSKKELINFEVVKLVHVGAISLNTMHTEKMVNWIIEQNGKFSIDFYSDNVSNEAKFFFENLKNDSVRLLGAINYFELPKILINYDIGLTIYNGHIPNFVFNVPNKVFEYLACGLDVWYSNDLISIHKINSNINFFHEKEEIPHFLRKLILKNEIFFEDKLLNKILETIKI